MYGWPPMMQVFTGMTEQTSFTTLYRTKAMTLRCSPSIKTTMVSSGSAHMNMEPLYIPERLLSDSGPERRNDVSL